MRLNEQGFALIAALWAVAALAAVCLAVGLEQRERRLRALNGLDEVRASATADAGIAHARAILAAESPLEWSPRRWTPDTAYLDQSWYVIRIEDANARLNVNAASAEELARLLIALRIDAGDADRLAQRVADWKDADDNVRPRGAERADYVDREMPVLPANRDFARVSELRAVLGMSEELYRKVEPFVTVDGSGAININRAPLEVLLAIPGITPDAAIAILQARRGGLRVLDLPTLGLRLHGPARAEFAANLAYLMHRFRFDSNDLMAVSTGGVVGGPVRVTRRVRLRTRR